MKIDPTYTLILTDKSWPLAIPLVDHNGTPIGQADYVYYNDQGDQREIFYTFEGKKFKLVKKVVTDNEEPTSDPDDQSTTR